MGIILDKAIASFAFPLGFSLLALIIANISILMGSRRAGSIAALCVIAVLWMSSTPLVSWWATASLEGRYPVRSVEQLGPADVAIVLGGGVSPPSKQNPYLDLTGASDRLFHAVRIYQAGRVKRILVSGGNVFDDGRMKEAEAIKGLLEKLGVPAEAIVLEPSSRNTHENAVGTKEVWDKHGFKNGLLVTSSSHMTRALAVFRRLGMDVAPASADRQIDRAMPSLPLSLLPDIGALQMTTAAFKEWLGLLVYRWRDWA